MTLFDEYVMVDWSANSTPKSGTDSIWIAHAERGADTTVSNPRTRFAAYEIVRGLLHHAIGRGARVLVGFDFPYGYPFGLASALGLEGEPWRAVWRELARLVVDEPNNRNNRWKVAAELNRRVGGDHGPFWNAPTLAVSADLLRTRGSFPFAAGSVCDLSEYRTVDRQLRDSGRQAHSCWKLFTPGSVGSQALVGIPVLERLRADPDLAAVSTVWPFETGFTPPAGPAIVHAEIWPGAVDVDMALHPIKDAAQVLSLAAFFAGLDDDGTLATLFGEPRALGAASACVNEEGWILGA